MEYFKGVRSLRASMIELLNSIFQDNKPFELITRYKRNLKTCFVDKINIQARNVKYHNQHYVTSFFIRRKYCVQNERRTMFKFREGTFIEPAESVTQF